MKRKASKKGRKLNRKRSRPVQNRYEAATFQFGDRSWLPASIQDSRFDADASTRLELLRRSRYWERNNGIVNRLADVYEQYTVGPTGLALTPSTSDQTWNETLGQWWQAWSKFPDANSLQPLGVLQSIMARAWFVDGECFIYKTYSRDTGRPRIQLIEGHRIGTPPDRRDDEGKSIIDGVEFGLGSDGRPNGKPKRYWYRTDDVAYPSGLYLPAVTQGTWIPLDAEKVIHLFEPCRPGMCRGLPMLYPVMNDLHDLDDLQTLEMKAAKAAAEIANVVTNKTGEANTSSSRRQKWQIQSQDANGNPQTKQNPMFYEVTMGGRTVHIVNGEKFEQFQSNRPSVATKEYWDYLVRKICAGVGISSLLVLPFSLQGTVTRADLDIAASFFRSRSSVVAAVLRELYVWVMGWAIKYDRSLDGQPPADWYQVSVRPPRSVNVDVGRNSQAILAELEGGVRTYQDVCGQDGHDWRQVLQQKAEEADYINQLVKQYPGVTRDQIALLAKIGPQSPGEGEGEPAKQTKETAPA